MNLHAAIAKLKAARAARAAALITQMQKAGISDIRQPGELTDAELDEALYAAHAAAYPHHHGVPAPGNPAAILISDTRDLRSMTLAELDADVATLTARTS